jgi:hypothetical protein
MSDSTSIPTLARADQNLYARCLKQIHEDLKLIQKSFTRFAKNMATIRDKRLYFAGGYATFEEFCHKEIGRTRQQVYRVIAANDVLQHLLTQGVLEAELPDTERLCREIRALPLEAQAPVWKAVVRAQRDKYRKPTIIDVQEEAVKHVNSEATIERQQKEALSKFEGMARGLKVGLAFDVMSDDFRRRVTVTLMAIADSVKVLLAALNSSAVQERVEADTESTEEAESKSGEDKARIIREEIAKHHGERDTDKKAGASKRRVALRATRS